MKLRIANKIAKQAGERTIPISLILKAGLRLSWGKYCYFGKKCILLLDSEKEINGRIICDPKYSSTIIEREDGIVQRGGSFKIRKNNAWSRN